MILIQEGKALFFVTREEKKNSLEVNTKTRRHPHQKKSFGIAMWKSQHRGTHFNVSDSKLFPKVLSREAKSSNLLQTWFSENISFLRKDKISRPISKKEFLLFTFLMTTILVYLFRQIISSDHFKKLIHQHSLDCLQILQWQYHNALHWQFYSGKILLSIIDAFNFIEFEGKLTDFFAPE